MAYNDIHSPIKVMIAFFPYFFLTSVDFMELYDFTSVSDIALN